jgi:hypothetical protein
MFGKKVLEGAVRSKDFVDIDTYGLASGVYCVSLFNDDACIGRMTLSVVR